MTSMKKRPSALHTKGEMHGCIVCGKLYQIYVVSDANDKFLGCKVMSVGGGPIPNDDHPLTAWGKHFDQEIEAAVRRVYDKLEKDD